MQQLLFEHTQKDFKSNAQNHLNIECGFGLLKACILDQQEVIWAFASETDNPIEEVIKQGLSKIGFERVTISFANEYFTLVPNAIFDEE